MAKIFTPKSNSGLFFLSLLFLVAGHAVQGQIYYHPFPTGNNPHPYNGGAVMDPNLSDSSWANSYGQWDAFVGQNGYGLALNGNSTATLTFNVAPNYQLAVTSFNFWANTSPQGTQNWLMTINGIAVGNGTLPTTAAEIGNTNVANAVSGLTGTVTVVLHGYNSFHTDTAGFVFDNFKLEGAVIPICAAPVIASIFPETGPENTLVKINGSGFATGSGTAAVRFNGIDSTIYNVVSDVLIEAVVPAGNTSGTVSVVSNGCEGYAPVNFTRLSLGALNVQELYISEIYDAEVGTGGIIEIYNSTAGAMDLTGHTFRRYNNIGDTVFSYEILLSGIIQTEGIFLIGFGYFSCNVSKQYEHQAGFNANDKMELVKDGVVIDVVHTPDNAGFSMTRAPDAQAPKVNFTANDWNISNSEDCSDMLHHTTTVTALPTITNPDIPLACENGQVSFSATLSDPAGYTYQWKILDASGAWVNVTDTGSYSGSNTNTLTIDPVLIDFDNNQYYCLATSALNTVVSNADLLEVSAVTIPVTDFSYTTPICAGVPVLPIPAPGFTAGGTYTSDANLSINPETGQIDVGASTTGSHIVTYTVASLDNGMCNDEVSSTFMIQIDSSNAPVTSITYQTPNCTGGASIMPVLAAGFTMGGVFSSDEDLSINAMTGQINIVGSISGFHTIMYAVNANPVTCTEAGTSSFVIEIGNSVIPMVDFSYPTPICLNSGPIMPVLATGFVTGGTFSSDTGLSINPATGEVNVATSTLASHSVLYTLPENPATCQEAGSHSFTININDATVPPTDFSYPTPICTASAPIAPAPGTGFETGGTYSGDTGLIIHASTGEIDVAGSTPGIHTIVYTIDADLSNCSQGGNSTFVIQINSGIIPVTGFSYPTPICGNSPVVNPIHAPGFTPGGSYTSTPGLSLDATTGAIDVAASTPGPYTLNYTIDPDPVTCNAGGTNTFPIVINPVFTPVTAFAYTTPICADGPPANPIPNAGFVAGGTYASDAGLIINPVTGQINVAASTEGPHTITYTLLPDPGDCNLGNSHSFAISIDATGTIAPIAGSAVVCIGETIQLSNATLGGIWSSSDTSVATVDSTGLVTGVTSNYADIIYTVANTCNTFVASHITVFANPDPLMEDKYLCVNNTTGNPYNAVLLECGIPNANFTFEWTLNGMPLPTYANTHLAGELGVYEVTVTNTISGCTNIASCTVSASSTAVATAAVAEDFNQNQVITVNLTGGSGDYLFQLDHGIPQESNIFPYAHQGEYTIRIIDKNGCQDMILKVFALNYPRFFTPNGDGFNDTWGIKGLTDLKASAYIYDRFGKLIKFLNASGEEWDGTFNGQGLPATDYWFLLEYENSDGLHKEFKANFSLKR